MALRRMHGGDRGDLVEIDVMARYPYIMRGEPRRRHTPTIADAPDSRIHRPEYTVSAAQVIRRLTRSNALDPRLAPTDRHMQRWAVGQGSGFPDADRALFVQSRLTPLSPDIDIKTDQIVLACPEHWRLFIGRWYRSDCSVQQLADEMGMRRDKLFLERRIVLAYLLGHLTAIGIRISTFEPAP